jgi:prepilin-type N-terminal cleavage/methylation domain-containing protein
MRKHEFRRPGLTLLELIVVLMILVTLAAIIVPLMNGVSSDAQVTTTNATMAALRTSVMQYYQDMKGISLSRPIPGTAFVSDSTGMPQTLKDLQIQPTSTDTSGHSILFNPATGRGWRGPYVLQATGIFLKVAAAPSLGTSLDASFYPGAPSYGSLGDVAFLDGWGNPIVLQWPSVGTGSTTDPNFDLAQRVQDVRLVSTGPLSMNASGNMAGVIDTLQSVPIPIGPNTAVLQGEANQRGNDMVLFILIQDPTP